MSYTKEYIAAYEERCQGASSFAGPRDNNTPEVWNGLMLMGLAMANLDLINIHDMVEPESYWWKLQMIEHDVTKVYWIVERDYFAKRL